MESFQTERGDNATCNIIDMNKIPGGSQRSDLDFILGPDCMK